MGSSSKSNWIKNVLRPAIRRRLERKENFDNLLELTDVKLTPWRDIADRIQNPIDAGEIRGISIRSLETFPTHPGLLFVRAVSEIMCSDGDESTTRQALYTSFKNSSSLSINSFIKCHGNTNI